MNIGLLKQNCQEDYERRLTDVVEKILDLELRDKSGLLKRILNFNRQWLYQCMGKILDVSQSSVIYNRDELSFFESLIHFFGYYMYDDGELCIKYEKYKEGGFVDCNKNDSNARPYLAYMTFEDENTLKVAREIEVLNLLNIIENKEMKRIKFLIEDKMVEKDYKPNPDDYINYF